MNNKDQIRQYNGTTESVFVVDIDGGGNDVDTCLILLVHKERLILFSTVEGARYPQRARWADNVAVWTGDELMQFVLGD